MNTALDEAEIQQKRIDAAVDETRDLAAGILGTWNRSEHQSVIKSDDQGAAAAFVQDPIQPNLLAGMTQGRFLSVEITRLCVQKGIVNALLFAIIVL
ncbi:MAG TPA: hypothetical protein VHX37_18450 [Acidobacteriaceae bacterium]|nr:hypothetical protein [Acidobacteriaceae bacterium]